MNRCRRCSGLIPEGLSFCVSGRSMDGEVKVKFNGCSELRIPIIRPRAGKKRNFNGANAWEKPISKSIEPSLDEHSIPLSGQVPVWMSLDVRWHPAHYNKCASGSVWTYERYGFRWSRFARMVRLIAREQGIDLVGLHVPTLALADVVEAHLLDLR